MSSSVIDSFAAAAVPPSSGIARVELLLASTTAAEADTELRRVAAACGLGAIGRPRDGATPWCGVPVDATSAGVDLGGVLRQVAVIERGDGCARSWRGLAFVRHGHLLAAVPPRHAAIVVRPVSGPAVLLAAPPPWPQDVLAELTRQAGAKALHSTAADGAGASSVPDSSAWLVALTFPHFLPPAAFVEQLLAGAGLPVRRLVCPPDATPASRCWAELDPTPCADVAHALAALHRVHRVVGQSWAVL
jgi:hypothetical protein